MENLGGAIMLPLPCLKVERKSERKYQDAPWSCGQHRRTGDGRGMDVPPHPALLPAATGQILQPIFNNP